MKSSNRMVVRVLTAAKEHLWDGTGPQLAGKVRYICNAVHRTDGRRRSGAWGIAASEIKDMITTRINHCATLEAWLREQGIDHDTITPIAIQAHRLAWIDILIEEFNSK